MEAGNRCFDERVPEEANRRIVDQLSDINLPYSSIARENLLREGLPSDRVIKTGSPLNEVIGHYYERISESQVLETLHLKRTEYFLVSVHREENCTPEKFKALCDMLNTFADRYHKRVIVSAHPRIARRLNSFGGDFRNEIEIHKPFGFFDYNKLQYNARVVLSDSGTITEESVLQGFPALNLRETHERPEGMEQAAVIMTGFKNAVDCVPTATAHYPARIPDDWSHTNVSQKVVRIILSYVDYVNRKVYGRK
jgi:UDP-N-acetylglucosamine 2-epimerase (non-hydrolysing)